MQTKINKLWNINNGLIKENAKLNTIIDKNKEETLNHKKIISDLQALVENLFKKNDAVKDLNKMLKNKVKYQKIEIENSHSNSDLSNEYKN